MALSPELDPVLDHLAGRIARGQLVVLVGAGASRWAGLPTWKEVVCTLAEELAPALREAVPGAARRFAPPSPEDPLLSVDVFMKISEAFRWVCGEERLHQRIRALFDARVTRGELPLHRLLVRLSEHVPAIYTTNFDDLLERAFAAAGKPYQVVAEARDLHEWRHDEIDGRFVPRFPIYKLHGSLERPQTIVLGESDFQRRQGLASHPIDLRFCSDVVGREVLLIGYSFSDPNVRWLWTKLRDLDVLPVAYFLELGASSDLDVAYFLKDRVYRVDLNASDRDRPKELLDFLEALLQRCVPPSPVRSSPRRA
ncbi:MAG TPA: SIR2 family protein [Anaeromyxobacteraceae bacterium]|nr:SIR2 family protein [Anaeromyxobacteraceae bacterium]